MTALRSSRFWLLLAPWVAVAAVAVYSIHLANDIGTEKAAREAAATAEKVKRDAMIDANYQACLRSVPQLHWVNEFVLGVQTLGRVAILNAEDMHAIATPGTDVYRQQAVNIARLKKAGVAINAVHFPQPTKAQCKAQRAAARKR